MVIVNPSLLFVFIKVLFSAESVAPFNFVVEGLFQRLHKRLWLPDA